ncbi:MAG: hypothetical protein ABI972_07600 [Acidobacteriota bacterium]
MRRLPFLLVLSVGASLAQQTKPVVATSTFYDVDDANNRAFVEFSKTSTKKLVEAHMKEDPAVRSVILSERLFGGNPSPEGRYRLVSIRDGYAILDTAKLGAISMKATGMSYDDYLKKVNTLRKRTGSSIRVRTASTAGNMPTGIAEGDILQTDLMKISPDRAADYYNLEQNDWQPVHAQRVKDGTIKSWSCWAFRSPGGASRPYDAVTSTIYKDFETAMSNPGYQALFAKVHPNRNYAAISDRGRTVRTIVRVDYWRVIWALARP